VEIYTGIGFYHLICPIIWFYRAWKHFYCKTDWNRGPIGYVLKEYKDPLQQ